MGSNDAQMGDPLRGGSRGGGSRSGGSTGGGERRAGLTLGPRPRFVRKRDGREVPFDPAKIAAAVARAQAALGERDPDFAADVAAVVELSLRRRAVEGGAGDEASVPEIEVLQDLVEEALVELGRAKLAKAYILYRDRRARAREALAVRGSPPGGTELPPGGVRVRESERTSPWSKARIAAALVAEADLPRALADDVATRVEGRVFAAGVATLSTGLIRALVDNELVELGQTRALARHAPLSLARHDVRRALAGEGTAVFEPWGQGNDPLRRVAGQVAPTGLGHALGGELLRRFALDEVLDPRSAQLHLEGDLSVEDLGSAHLYLTLGVPLELALGGLAPEGGAFALLEGLGGLLGTVSRGLVLEDCGPLLSELARATRPRSPLGLAGWLSGLGGLAAASGKRIDIASPGPRHAAARGRLLEELAREDGTPFAPRLLVDEEEFDAIAAESEDNGAALERLAARGGLIVTWSRGEGQSCALGAERRPGERGLVACGGAVALNLVRLVRRAGPWREERLFEELAGLINVALEACRSLAAYQQATVATRPGPLRPRVGYALVPIGLREALRIFGDGEPDPALGARLLGLMGEAARRFPAPGAQEVRLAPFFGERAARRLAWLDAGAPGVDGQGQGVLFRGADGVRSKVYSSGFLISPLGGWRDGEPEAQLARTVPLGALYPAFDTPVSRPHAATEALARFRAARRARAFAREAWLPLEPNDQRLGAASDLDAPLAALGTAGYTIFGATAPLGEFAPHGTVPAPRTRARDVRSPSDTFPPDP